MTTTTTGTAFLSVPPSTSLQFQLSKQLPYFTSRLPATCQTTTRLSLQLIPLLRCPSVSSTSIPGVEQVEEGSRSVSPPPIVNDDGTCAQSDFSAPIQDSDPRTPPGGCKACGREEIEKGCNGEGRIQGGIATVPGFGWWPIKAYRPCPGFLASGGRYRRVGQSMDEVASGGYNRAGRREKGASMATDNDTQTRTETENLKFKDDTVTNKVDPSA